MSLLPYPVTTTAADNIVSLYLQCSRRLWRRRKTRRCERVRRRASTAPPLASPHPRSHGRRMGAVTSQRRGNAACTWSLLTMPSSSCASVAPTRASTAALLPTLQAPSWPTSPSVSLVGPCHVLPPWQLCGCHVWRSGVVARASDSTNTTQVSIQCCSVFSGVWHDSFWNDVKWQV